MRAMKQQTKLNKPGATFFISLNELLFFENWHVSNARVKTDVFLVMRVLIENRKKHNVLNTTIVVFNPFY